MEVLKNLKEDEDEFEARDISSTKMRNVANAYAWWVAKDCVALSIFKVSCMDRSNFRLTELELPARGLHSAQASNTRFLIIFLPPALRKQPSIGSSFRQ